ncbi:MAG: response regulator [Spirochaetales bacterium]|nr:response regulator [Spirochaetales bacterium]
MISQKIKIYAIDDEQNVLNMIENICAPHEVKTELYPEKAVEMIKREKFDIFIVDYQMPVMNGIELLEVIKEIYVDDVYIGIFCTAFGTIHLFKEEFTRDLFSYFVEKPFDAESLKEIVNRSVAKLMRMRQMQK